MVTQKYKVNVIGWGLSVDGLQNVCKHLVFHKAISFYYTTTEHSTCPLFVDPQPNESKFSNISVKAGPLDLA